MKCLSCSHSWKRTKLSEYVSLLSSCPNCGSRLLARNDFILSIVNALDSYHAPLNSAVFVSKPLGLVGFEIGLNV